MLCAMSGEKRREGRRGRRGKEMARKKKIEGEGERDLRIMFRETENEEVGVSLGAVDIRYIQRHCRPLE